MDNTFFKAVKITTEQAQFLKKIMRGDSNITEQQKKDFISPLVDLVESHRAIVLQLNNSENSEKFDELEIHELSEPFGALFGDLLVQNEQGAKVITVYDRDRLGSMFSGARYHQTREGGSIHTDNVNVPELWDYLYLSCISPAYVGGENILVDGVLINKLLEEKFPKAFEVLKSPFIWEMRGVKDELYHAPIITYDEKGEPHFRHLRPYMESAHVKAETPLTAEQLYALDVLDALLNDSNNQVRYRMQAGDILLSKDDQVLHGRTCFSDDLEAVSIEDLGNQPNRPLKRTMDRLWVKR